MAYSFYIECKKYDSILKYKLRIRYRYIELKGRCFFIFIKFDFMITVVEILFFNMYIVNKYFLVKKIFINDIIVIFLSFAVISYSHHFIWIYIYIYLSGYILFYYYSKDFVFSILFILIGYFLTQVNEVIVYHLVNIFIKVTHNMYWETFISINLIKIFLYLIGMIIVIKMDKYNFLLLYMKELPKKWKTVLVFFYFLISIMVWFQEYQIQVGEISYWIDTISITFIVMLFLGIIYMLLNIIRYKNELDYLMINSDRESVEINEVKKFKHDYKNLLLTLQIYLKENKVEEAKILLEEISKYSMEIFKDNANNFKDLNKITIVPIRSILSLKLNEAVNKKIRVKLYINREINDIGIMPLEFIRILTNILDNAIEACSEVEKNPYIYVNIIKEEWLAIEIINSCFESNNYELDKLIKKGFTTKINHSGLGLSYLSELASTKLGISYAIEKTNDKFKTIIYISNKTR